MTKQLTLIEKINLKINLKGECEADVITNYRAKGYSKKTARMAATGAIYDFQRALIIK